MDALKHAKKLTDLFANPNPGDILWGADVQTEVQALAELVFPKGKLTKPEREIRATVYLKIPIDAFEAKAVEAEIRKILPPGVELLDWKSE